jgi:hypothetical protein
MVATDFYPLASLDCTDLQDSHSVKIGAICGKILLSSLVDALVIWGKS